MSARRTLIRFAPSSTTSVSPLFTSTPRPAIVSVMAAADTTVCSSDPAMAAITLGTGPGMIAPLH